MDSIKNDRDYLDTALYVCMKAVVVLSCVGDPFIPFTSKKLREFLSIDSFSWKNIKDIEPRVISKVKNLIYFSRRLTKNNRRGKERMGQPNYKIV